VSRYALRHSAVERAATNASKSGVADVGCSVTV
jgi:hypothetical protein